QADDPDYGSGSPMGSAPRERGDRLVLVQQDACEAAEGDEDWFGDLFPQQQAERDDGDGGGGQIGHGLAGEPGDGRGDGPCGGGGGGFDERFDLGVVAVPDEPPAGDSDAEVDRGEDGRGGDEGAGQAGHEVADEGGGDDHRAGGDEAHGDGVDEL